MAQIHICLLSLLVLSVGIATAQQFAPHATLYSGKGCSGDSLELPTIDFAYDLAEHQFDNKAQSVSLRGTWLFYGTVRFNEGQPDLVDYKFAATTTCVDFEEISEQISSAKYGGEGLDYRIDSITLFENTTFQAREEYLASDRPRLSYEFSSLIITGTSGWTVYDKPYYGGNRICLLPEHSPIYEPTFITDTLFLDPSLPHGWVASVRKGCE